jgi:hypothetical protein
MTVGAGQVMRLDRLASAKPGLVDRLIHGAYVSQGGRMATFEKASAKLDCVDVL